MKRTLGKINNSEHEKRIPCCFLLISIDWYVTMFHFHWEKMEGFFSSFPRDYSHLNRYVTNVSRINKSRNTPSIYFLHSLQVIFMLGQWECRWIPERRTPLQNKIGERGSANWYDEYICFTFCLKWNFNVMHQSV